MEAKEGDMVDLGLEGDLLVCRAADGQLDFLLLGGVPIGEPMARYGTLPSLSSSSRPSAMIDTVCRSVCDEHARGNRTSIHGLSVWKNGLHRLLNTVYKINHSFDEWNFIATVFSLFSLESVMTGRIQISIWQGRVHITVTFAIIMILLSKLCSTADKT